MNAERNLLTLQRELRDGNYRPRAYHQFRIWKLKDRVISAVPLRNRAVHHAVANVLQPICEWPFSPNSSACQKEKGVKAAEALPTSIAGTSAWHGREALDLGRLRRPRRESLR